MIEWLHDGSLLPPTALALLAAMLWKAPPDLLQHQRDVLVVSTGHDRTCGCLGELLTAACLYKGFRGVVMDSCTREIWKINNLAFPVFGMGCHPADSKGPVDVFEIETDITLGDVRIGPLACRPPPEC